MYLSSNLLNLPFRDRIALYTEKEILKSLSVGYKLYSRKNQLYISIKLYISNKVPSILSQCFITACNCTAFLFHVWLKISVGIPTSDRWKNLILIQFHSIANRRKQICSNQRLDSSFFLLRIYSQRVTKLIRCAFGNFSDVSRINSRSESERDSLGQTWSLLLATFRTVKVKRWSFRRALLGLKERYFTRSLPDIWLWYRMRVSQTRKGGPETK